MHIIYRNKTQKTKKIVKDKQKIEKIWHKKIIIIVDKMSIVNLGLFVTMDLHFDNAKALHKNLCAILDELPIIIFLSDFFQFYLVIKRFL